MLHIYINAEAYRAYTYAERKPFFLKKKTSVKNYKWFIVKKYKVLSLKWNFFFIKMTYYK
jgi:hypothetical protein